MGIFVLREELRTYWVGAAGEGGVLKIVREYLAKWEEASPSDIVESLGDGVEIEPVLSQDVPEVLRDLEFLRDYQQMNRIVLATQWEGEEEPEPSAHLDHLVAHHEDHQDKPPKPPKQRVKNKGHHAHTNARRRARNKRG